MSYLMIYFLLFINISSCSSYDITYRTSADPGYKIISISPSDLDIKYSTSKDSGYVYATPEGRDYTNELSTESHSTGSYYVGAQGPAISIEKYTKDFRDIYNKNDNITIKIKIINSNKQNRLKNVYIFEEIPDGFEFVEANPVNITIPNKPNTIIWDCGDGIKSSKTYEFTLKTNVNGKHNFGSTMLEATVVDKNGRKNEVVVNSNRLISIVISNNPPKFSDLNPEPPINIRRTLIGNKPVDIKYINVSLTDPDNDTINCELLSSSGCKPIIATTSSSNKINGTIYFNYSWDISGFDRGTHVLTLDAFDGDEHKLSQDIKLNIYNIPSGITASLIAILIIVIAGLIVKHNFIFSYIKRKLERNWIICFILCYIKYKIVRDLIVCKLERNQAIRPIKHKHKIIKNKAISYTQSYDAPPDITSDKKNNNIAHADADSIDSSPPQEPKKKKDEDEDETDLSDHDHLCGYGDDS